MAARLMARQGFKIVCVIEYDGAVYNPNGLDIPKLLEHRRETGSITDFPDGENIDREQAMYLECDVLLPAARENVITSENAHKIRAKILCEGANGPTTAVADQILAEKKVFVIPDILANAGGVTVSYFEWVQNIQQFTWDEERITSELGRHVREAYATLARVARERKVSFRTAAYIVAIGRVGRATALRGV
jgi:glutamate dehydrogenase (NAD(P)+)